MAKFTHGHKRPIFAASPDAAQAVGGEAPAICLDCYKSVAWNENDSDVRHVVLCPLHAACAELYEALKACEQYFAERASPSPDYLLRRRYREEAEAAARAALTKVERGQK